MLRVYMLGVLPSIQERCRFAASALTDSISENEVISFLSKLKIHNLSNAKFYRTNINPIVFRNIHSIRNDKLEAFLKTIKPNHFWQ